MKAFFASLTLVAILATRLPADSTVVFNEVMYHPLDRELELEWCELHNQMAVDMDISGWSLGEGVFFAFPEGTIIPGGGYLVVAIAPVALETETGHAGALGPYDGRLSNAGESIGLFNNNRRLMDHLDYGVGGNWPVAPDGSGLSLARSAPSPRAILQQTGRRALKWEARRERRTSPRPRRERSWPSTRPS